MLTASYGSHIQLRKFDSPNYVLFGCSSIIDPKKCTVSQWLIPQKIKIRRCIYNSIYFSYSDAQKSNCSQQDKVIYNWEEQIMYCFSTTATSKGSQSEDSYILYSYKNQQINYVSQQAMEDMYISTNSLLCMVPQGPLPKGSKSENASINKRHATILWPFPHLSTNR